MPLTLHVGLSKKIGLPNYGSLGASCHLEIELDTQLMTRDRDEYDRQVQQAFEACSQAVQEELDRQLTPPQPAAADQAAPPAEVLHGDGQVADHTNGTTNGAPTEKTNGQSRPHAARSDTTRSRRRLATSSQVRAIFAIAGRQNVNLEQSLKERFGVQHPSELNIGDASRFIDELQLLAAGTGGRV